MDEIDKPVHVRKYEDLMGKSSEKLLEELCGQSKPNVPDWQLRVLIINMRNAEANSRLSRQIVRLTWALVALTLILSVFGAIQLLMN